MPTVTGICILFCLQTAPPAPAAAHAGATFCQVAKPFYWSATDSRATKEQADEHNRVGRKLCGWKGSGK